MKFWKKASIVLGLGLALQGTAQAGPLVTTWQYVFDSNWLSALPSPGVTISPDNHTLSWGVSTGFGQSQLSIILPTVSTSVVTNGAAANGSELRHSNQPINGLSLSSAVLNSQIQFSPLLPTPGAPLVPAFSINSNIKFSETTNSGACLINPFLSQCPDILVLEAIVPQTVSFNYDGNNYAVDIFPSLTEGVQPLGSAVCGALGEPLDCVGFSTEERLTTPLQLAFTVIGTPTAIPEPGSLALLGLGLVGLVAARRRQQA